jgi:hypothetical protein
MKIAFLTIATNKYISFLEELTNSLDEYCNFKDISLFAFTNKKIDIKTKNVNFFNEYISHVPHPLGSLLRYHYYLEIEENLNDYDYIFHIDGDMRLVSSVGEEIISDLVAVSHPGFFQIKNYTKYTYERNPNSKAFVSLTENLSSVNYYQGCFQGGSSKEFIKMCLTIKDWVNQDLKNNIIPLWHDESYMNRYMINKKPTLVLDPGYAFPENWNIPFQKKIVHLDKNPEYIRI